ncbi:Type 1 glutamine amidotransferase-like domain-containing protein [bacterium]|nr:MAG: Type 1 glutamine amidotransferase-like domain-containing protein [bacterium]
MRGNTFKLLKFARKSNFKTSIESLLDRNGIYIGVSAGSIIVGPSIEIAGEVSADKNEVGLEDYTGLGITNLIVLPHYSSDIEEQAKAFEEKYKVCVERINNSQAIFIENGKRPLLNKKRGTLSYTSIIRVVPQFFSSSILLLCPLKSPRQAHK